MNAIPVELEFVPSQQPEEPFEGLLAWLRERWWDARLARSPHWGSGASAQALILWVPPGTPMSHARDLATVTGVWLRRHPVERGRLQPEATLRVMSRRSGHVLAERRIEHVQVVHHLADALLDGAR